jgi:hypothetical protein
MTNQELHELIQEDLTKAKKSRMLVAGVMGVLAMGLVIYMNWLLGMVNQVVDEDLLASYITKQVEQKIIPESKPAMTDVLLNKVPPLVDDVVQQATALLPTIRRSFMSIAEENLDTMLADVELTLDERMQQQLEASAPRMRGTLDRIDSPAGRKALSEEMAKVLTEEYVYTTHNYMREFQAGLIKFNRELKTLLLTPEKDLTPNQWERKRLFLLIYANIETVLHDGGSLAFEQFRLLMDAVSKPVTLSAS